MRSLVDLHACLVADAARLTGIDLSRDLQTILARTENEGDQFLTITLPQFSTAFERALETGGIDPSLFPAFKRWKKSSPLPAFLRGLVSMVFGVDGNLLREPRVDCIRAVRQICLFAKKVERPCSGKRLEAATRAYRSCDEGIVEPEPVLRYCFREVASIITQDVFREFPDLVPRHGPGATQEGRHGNTKWTRLGEVWHERLDSVGLTRHGLVFPEEPNWNALDCAFTLKNYMKRKRFREDLGIKDATDFRSLPPDEEPPVRVVFVPKTQKTPRVIAVEPVCMQFVQQGLFRYLARCLEKAPITAGRINFSDQTINQSLALESSIDRRLATVDLSEASDRVSLGLAEDMLSGNKDLLDLVMACRSSRAKLPSGEEITLRKFASMGSALCFPVEAMVFFTIIIASRLASRGLPPTRRNVLKMSRSVYVYGDDLLFPSDEMPSVCEALESYGLKVNRSKSFSKGNFRESCGVDAFAGELVTPIYLRRDVPSTRRDVHAVLSTVATANQLFHAGYRSTCYALKEDVESLLGPLPQVGGEFQDWFSQFSSGKPVGESAAIGWTFPAEGKPRKRFNGFLQRFEYLCLTPEVLRAKDPLEGYLALAKCLRSARGSIQNYASQFRETDPDHLERSVRRYALNLKRTWVSGPIGLSGAAL